MGINDKIQFLGLLGEIDTRTEQALKEITELWEEGSIRLKEDDLVLLNGYITKIRKTLKQIESFNHEKFGLITKEAIENKIKQ